MSLVNRKLLFLRLFLPLCFLVVIAVLFLGKSHIESSRTRLLSDEALHLSLGAGAMSHEMKSVTQDLAFLSHHSALRKAVDSPTATNIGQLAQDFSIFSQRKGIYDQVRWIDETGMEITRVDIVKGKAVIVEPEKLQNKGKRYFFTDTIQLKPDEIFVSPLDLNVEHDKIDVPYKPMLRVATPVLGKQGTKRGIVILNLYGRTLLDDFKEATLTIADHAMVLNQDGYWLKSPIPENDWGFMFNRPGSSLPIRYPEVWTSIRAEDRGQKVIGGDLWTWEKVYPLQLGQKSSTGSSGAFTNSMGAVLAKDYCWITAARLPKERWLASRGAAWRGLGAITVLLLGVIGLGSWKQATLWTNLALTEEELRRLNTSLEMLVKERTSELNNKVAELDAEMAEHKKAEQARLELQAQLLQSQKMESLGILAGGVAHDMNNVLGAILGLASAHIGSQPHGSALHQALDTICKATERGGKMVKSLLSFARQSPAEENQLDMNALIRDQVGLLERTTLARVRLEMDLEAELRPIRGDANALTHAFMNLCVNAVDAMTGNGTLTLHTRNVDKGWIEVVVEDNGMGMPKEVLEKALDPFFTTKESGKGTGLGLSMTFSTVKAHRGQMTIESEQNKGTRVVLRFPACEQETRDQSAEPAVAEAAPIPHGSLKVLVVDDDELIRSSVQAILEAMGHTAVTTAQNGEEALALLEAGGEADLIILDMNMPGLGGAGMLPRLRVVCPEVPVLLATGRADQTALDLVSAYPGVTLMAKPFGLRELQKNIENLGLR